MTWHDSCAAANAYRYAMTRTRLTIERGHANGQWHLTGVIRTQVYPQQAEEFDIRISCDQANWLVRRALRLYSVSRRPMRRAA